MELLKNKINLEKCQFFKCCALGSDLPIWSFPEIVFVGRSNVGKSSIINNLVGRKKLARVSSMPGKTTTINFYKAGGGFLVDFPGYGFAKVSKFEKSRWLKLTSSYFYGNRFVKLAILIIDCRRGFMNSDLKMMSLFKDRGLNFFVVLNKIDKLTALQLNNLCHNIQNQFSDLSFLKFSAKTRCGLFELKEFVKNYV